MTDNNTAQIPGCLTWEPIVGQDLTVQGVRLAVTDWHAEQISPVDLQDQLSAMTATAREHVDQPGLPIALWLAPPPSSADALADHWPSDAIDPGTAVIELPLSWALADDGLAVVSRLRETGLQVALSAFADVRHHQRFAMEIRPVAANIEKIAQYLLVAKPTRWSRLSPTKLITVHPATVAIATEAFADGAVAVVGWPASPAVPGRLTSSSRHILHLLSLIQADAEDVAIAEHMKLDPRLTVLLLQHVNAAAIAPVHRLGNAGEALRRIGRGQLQRWLIHRLAHTMTTADGQGEVNLHALIARGYLMEQLSEALGSSAPGCDAAYIAGVVSLLPRLTGVAMSELTDALPPSVADVLIGRPGAAVGDHRLSELLALCWALEGNDPVEVAASCGRLGISSEARNQCLLEALARARSASTSSSAT